MIQSVKKVQGTQVVAGKHRDKKIGKVGLAVFAPDQPRLVGFMVRQPDLALMIKRPDRFLAFDAFTVRDGNFVVENEKGAWDKEACTRLGVDLDYCRIFEGMPLQTTDGRDFGTVFDISYDEDTGTIASMSASQSTVAGAVLGRTDIPLQYLAGCSRTAVLVKPEAMDLQLNGGLAAKAGAATGRMGTKIKSGAKDLGGKAKDGAVLLGEKAREGVAHIEEKSKDGSIEQGALSLGKQVAKTKTMFSDFKEEFKKGMDGID